MPALGIRSISYLAIFETVVATTLSFYVAFKLSHPWFLGLSASLAPFLLLRTKYSVEIGQSWYQGLVPRAGKTFFVDSSRSHDEREVLHFHFFLFVAVLSLLIRFAATIRCVLLHPTESIKAIPRNWFTQCFCIDLRTPLHPVPGIDSFPNPDDVSPDARVIRWLYPLGQLIGGVTAGALALVLTLALTVGLAIGAMELSDAFLQPSSVLTENVWLLLLVLVLGMFGIPAFAVIIGMRLVARSPELFVRLPAILYRWSLKSTSVIWLPLLWVLGPTQDSSSSAREVLDDIRNGVTFTFSLWFSAIVLIAFLAKLSLVGLNELYVAVPLVATYDLNQLWLWEVAAIVNGIITWAVFVAADRVLRKVDHRQQFDPSLAIGVLKWLMTARRILAVYVIANSLEIVLFLCGALQSLTINFTVWHK